MRGESLNLLGLIPIIKFDACDLPWSVYFLLSSQMHF